jgi:uncharacterized membrane protein
MLSRPTTIANLPGSLVRSVPSRLLILAIVALGPAPRLHAQQITSHTLVYAVYEGEQTAGEVLSSLRKTQHAAGEQIESYAVVSKGPDGKTTVHDRPTTPSPAIEVMLGTLGEPSRNDARAAPISTDVLDSLRVSLTPGSSAVIAVMNDRWARDVQRDLKAARARASMASVITQDTEDGTP